MSQGSGHKRSSKSQDKSMYYHREGNYRQGYQPASPRYIKEEAANDSPYDPTHVRNDVIDHKMEQELRDQELARMLWKQEIQLAKRRHEHENRRTHNNVNNANSNLNPHDKRSPSSSSSQYSDSPSLSNHHGTRHPVSGGSAVNSASSSNGHHYNHRHHQYNGNQRMYQENGKSGHNSKQSYYDYNHQHRHRKDNYSEFQASDRSSNSDFQGSEDGDIHQGIGDSDWNPMKFKARRQAQAQSDSSQSQDNSFESSNRTHLPKQFGNGFMPRSQLILEENHGDYNLSSRFRNSDGGRRWDINRKAASKMPRQHQECPSEAFSSRNMPVSNSECDFRSPHPNGHNPHTPSPQKLPKSKINRDITHLNGHGINQVVTTPNGKHQSSAAVDNNDDFEHEYEIVEPEDINNIVTRNLQGSKGTTSNVLAAIDPTVNQFGMAISNRPNKLDYENNKKKQFAVRPILSREDAIAMLQAGSTVLSQQLVMAKRRVSPSKTDSPPTDDRPKSKFKEFFQHLNHKKGKTSK